MKRVLLLLCAAAAMAQTGVPKFADYSATETFSGKPVPPVLKRPEDVYYRTMIRTEAGKGVNFAGRYTVAIWGCGSSCVMGALVDEKTGEVFKLPFSTLAASPGTFGDGSSAFENGFEMVAFKKESRLLIARGCENEDTNRCSASYYEWAGTQFKLIKKFGFTPAK